MSRQSITLAARIISLWFFIQAGLELFAFLSAAAQLSILGTEVGLRLYTSHLERLTAIQAAITVGKFLAYLIVGIFFYRCGPGVVQFLSGDAPGDRPAPVGENL